jgi:hypothetical protein
MMLKQTARPNPQVLCAKVELAKKNSMLGMPHLFRRLGSSKGRLRALLETLENASLPSKQILAPISTGREPAWSVFNC